MANDATDTPITGTESSRRQFLGVLSLAALVGLSSGTAAAQQQSEAEDFRAAPTWVGPASARPAPDGPLFDNKSGEVLYWATDTGEIAHLEIGGGGWETLQANVAAVELEDVEQPPEDRLKLINRNGDLYVRRFDQ